MLFLEKSCIQIFLVWLMYLDFEADIMLIFGIIVLLKNSATSLASLVCFEWTVFISASSVPFPFSLHRYLRHPKNICQTFIMPSFLSILFLMVSLSLLQHQNSFCASLVFRWCWAGKYSFPTSPSKLKFSWMVSHCSDQRSPRASTPMFLWRNVSNYYILWMGSGKD